MPKFSIGPIALAAALLAASPVAAGAWSAEHATPQELAQAMEQRAGRTSFAELDAFGERAMALSGRERLNRLYHVAWVFLNQSETARFEKWNDRLLKTARQDRDRRYEVVAQLNALQNRVTQGDAPALNEISRIAVGEPDWFARVHALRLKAGNLITGDQVGEALRILAAADALIPRDAPYAGTARAGVWEHTGVALMQLNDMQGAAAAFGRSEFEFSDPDYPRPDFDGIYNLGALAAQLGDQPVADAMYAAHHRLSARSDLANLKLWDRYLCTLVAEARDAPADVLRCLDGLGDDMGSARVLAGELLPARAAAQARLGRLGPALHDLKLLKELRKNGTVAPTSSLREHAAQAEVLRAQGRHAEAFEALRDYGRERHLRTVRKFSAGIRQVTAQMEGQLELRREQLATAKRNTALQQKLMIFAGLFVVSALGVLLWQLRIGRQLRHARRRAEAANRAKSEFLANMSHEIRTPLNGVVGVSDLLARAELPEREREMVEIVRSSSRALERLLSDVLDLARIEAGGVSLEQAPFVAADLTREVAALARPAAEAKGVTLEVEIAPELERSVRIGDAARIRQVLTNLVSNAVKFTDEGQVRVELEAVSPGEVRFTVTDTGVGFDAAQKERIFGRFQQADGSITRRFGGSGLGLAIARQLTELMGGCLSADSTPGQGASFRLELPLAPVKIEAAAPEPVAAPADERPLRVLLVDDHAVNRKVVQLILADFGADAVAVEDGAQAIEAFRQGAFDVVLMDMQMPVMDGLEATRQIRALEAASGRPRTPVLMLTANALPEHREAGEAAGADGHVAKPVTPASLLAALNAALPTEAGDPTAAAAA